LTGAATVGALGGNALHSLSAELAGPGTPARIGHIDVADLHRVIDGMEHADHAAGGRTVVRSLALGQLTWAQETLRLASFRMAGVRLAWTAAVARLGRLAGFMSVDARDHQTAKRCFLIALQIAAEADSWPSRHNVMSGMARQAVHLNDGDAALKIATLARAGEASASATTRAMLRVLEARAYGVLGRITEAMSAVEEAESLYAQRRPEDDPPWLWFYDEAQLMGDTGHALYPLALAGSKVDAARRLRTAVALHGPADNRGRVFSLIKLATLEVRHEPGHSAYATARDAITAVAVLRSGRALDYLGDLGRALRRSGADEALALAADISSTLRAVRRD
jgi:tetratricopeptide (TPR) repeat protein